MILSSESVTEGHPDKVCDQISDAILDAALAQDPKSRVAIETVTKTGFILLTGELTTKADIDFQEVARKTLKEIGYTSSETGLDADTCAIITSISKQSPDINQGVDREEDTGAGDQGMMFGYASNETEELMPLPIALAHKLVKQLSKVRKDGTLSYLRPDGKAQVSVDYTEDKPTVNTVVVSAHHAPDISQEQLKQDIMKQVIEPVCGDKLTPSTIFHINPTGKFEIGGPVADAGLTGRKIIVDTYGGIGRHGGGAFSGKDPTKVDRSGAYLARYIAKNIVAANLAKKCEVQIAYAIGVAEPVSLAVDCFGTNTVSEEKIISLVKTNFPLTPKKIIEHLNLLLPIYRNTAAYGHFGRDFPWEKTDKAQVLDLQRNL